MKIVIGVLYQGQLLATWETREELRRDWADVDDVRPYSFFQIFQGDGVFALGAQVNPWARDEFRGEFEEDEFEEEEQEEGLLTAVATIATETLRRLAEITAEFIIFAAPKGGAPRSDDREFKKKKAHQNGVS